MFEVKFTSQIHRGYNIPSQSNIINIIDSRDETNRDGQGAYKLTRDGAGDADMLKDTILVMLNGLEIVKMMEVETEMEMEMEKMVMVIAIEIVMVHVQTALGAIL